MIVIRLIPVFISTLLFAAHMMRFYGFYGAIPVVLLMLTLFWRTHWIIYFWQLLLALASIQWIEITVEFVYARISLGLPFYRLAIILGLVFIFTVFSLFWLQNKKIRKYYGFSNSD